ncbi:phosphonopyruvate decarboxylase [Candidatus Marinimicrobia bacterium PRS2]|nr:phosphonopyruvate decarboxylase [Candidatus Marinimicrobia bacterium PRS2]
MAISAEEFYNELASHGVELFTGVPDSLLKEFCLCVDDRMSKEQHIITANEGNAIALACGHYLAKQSIPLVYMQNSGLGNAINPLLSLCDPDVYSIPMLLLIGWRGEPGVKDEPQHVKQGKIQIELLKTMDIPYEIISKDSQDFKSKISKCIDRAKGENRPTALLIKKGTFDKYGKTVSAEEDQSMKREEALEIILDNLDDNTIVVSTTGKTSREIFEIREKNNQSHEQDFLTVGSMGHCSSIALGIALAKPHRQVVCIDGDGAMLMHLGSLTSIADMKPKNFRHILMNNKVHESVGGQSTAAKNINLSKVVNSLETSKIFFAESPNELKQKIREFLSNSELTFLEVKIQPGSRDNLGRPTKTPVENKVSFMKFLEN